MDSYTLYTETDYSSQSSWKDKTLWIIILIVVLILILESYITSKGTQSDKYSSLNKPSWQPAPIVFSVVWIILFSIIIYAWYKGNKLLEHGTRTTVNVLFAINLFLNFLWVYVFFGQYQLTAGVVVLILLIISTIVLIWYLWRYAKTPAILLLLYLGWLFVALALNSSYVSLNPDISSSNNNMNH
jgi:benzodiazapine receptor